MGENYPVKYQGGKLPHNPLQVAALRHSLRGLTPRHGLCGRTIKGIIGMNHCNLYESGEAVLAMTAWGIMMQKDDDLARQVLLDIEADPDPIHIFAIASGASEADRIRYYHMRLLVDAGLLEESGKHGGAFRITMAGHDFLAMTRTSEQWVAVKTVAKGLGGATLRMLAQVAEQMVIAKGREMGLLP